jgi:hypothetical protein
MWRRMSMAEESTGRDLLSKYDFLSTHPANEKRIKKINEWLPEVVSISACSLSLVLLTMLDRFVRQSRKEARCAVGSHPKWRLSGRRFSSSFETTGKRGGEKTSSRSLVYVVLHCARVTLYIETPTRPCSGCAQAAA